MNKIKNYFFLSKTFKKKLRYYYHKYIEKYIEKVKFFRQAISNMDALSCELKNSIVYLLKAHHYHLVITRLN